MEQVCWYCIYFIMLLCGQSYASDQSEPKCYSRFDYEEKMLLKLLKIEDEVGKFRQYIEQQKIKEESQVLERKKEHDQFVSTMEQMDNYMNTVSTSVNKSLKILDTELEQFKISSTVSPVAFTVTSPKSNVGSHLTFTTIVTNEGEGFNATTGYFTCIVPGLYYFSVHILKKASSYTSAFCYICKNESSKVRACTGPTSSGNRGIYGTSSAVNLRLDKDDVVGLCSCSSPSSLSSSSSSFSGHLVSRSFT